MPAGENVYALKVLNMDERPHRYDLHAEGIRGLDGRADRGGGGAVIETPMRLRCADARRHVIAPDRLKLVAADTG